MDYIRMDLNAREDKIYDIICDYSCLHGFSPSIREIAEMSGLASTSSVYANLKKLEEKGYIRRQFGCARTIEVM